MALRSKLNLDQIDCACAYLRPNAAAIRAPRNPPTPTSSPTSQFNSAGPRILPRETNGRFFMHPSQLASDHSSFEKTTSALNRKNAARSTGPITPEGKRRSGSTPSATASLARPSFCPETISPPIKSTAPSSTPSSSLTAFLKPKPSRPSPTPTGASIASAPWRTISSRSAFRSNRKT